MDFSLKASPSDFVVEEVPLSPFDGRGEHLVLFVEKVGVSTLDVVLALSRFLGIPEKAVGYAGMKDSCAVAYQYISVPRCDVSKVLSFCMEGVRVLDVFRHSRKLRVGQLAGNRFRIRLRNVKGMGELLARLERVKREGFPNFYHGQRFSGRNLELGLSLLAGKRVKASPYKRRLYVSAVSAWVFNMYLEERIKRVPFPEPLEGDLVLDGDYWTPLRFFQGETPIPTGPVPGYRMPLPEGKALELEREVLKKAGVELDAFRPFGAKGTRRPIVVFPRELEVEREGEDVVVLSFFLPRGAYATFMLDWIRSLQAP